MFFNIEPNVNFYKTFYICNLQMFVISLYICPCQAFPA